MALVWQHLRSGDNVSENFREGLKNGNVDKNESRYKNQKWHILKKQKTWSPHKLNF